VTFVGAPGSVVTVMELDAGDDALVPDALVAVTVNVYDVPLTSPLTVHDVIAVEQVSEPGEEVTV